MKPFQKVKDVIGRFKSWRADPPLAILLIISLAMHIALLRVFLLFTSNAIARQSAPDVQEVKLIYLDESGAEENKGPSKREPTRVKERPVLLAAIPMAVNNSARWIVDLRDILHEEEPLNARFVSERPSRVDEEMQAEHTSREPNSASSQKGAGTRKRKGILEEAHSEGNMTASQNPVQPTPPQIPRQASPTSTQPARQAGTQTGRQMTTQATQPQGSPPAGAPTASAGTGGGRTDQANPSAVKRSPGGKNLFPSLGELAQNARSSQSGEPGGGAVGGEGGDSGLPGVPQAPENFLPMVKKRGPITLLNAKSYTFSGFVRRVAHRIFDQFVIGFDPRRFGGSDWSDIQKGAVYEAVMNLNGRAVNIIERRSSGSNAFDSLVRSSVQRGAWDTNIPEGAECADGFVHFMFIPKVIPGEATSAADGSRTYSSFYLMAVAGIKECE